MVVVKMAVVVIVVLLGLEMLTWIMTTFIDGITVVTMFAVRSNSSNSCILNGNCSDGKDGEGGYCEA